MRRIGGTVGQVARGAFAIELGDGAHRYSVKRRLVVGKKATLFSATDKTTGFGVVIKRSHRRCAAFAHATQIRLHREARDASDAVPAVLAEGTDGAGRHYVVFEELVGQSLPVDQWLSIEEATAIARELALIFDALHQEGIVHGGLKPGHVFLTGAERRVALLDFSLAARTGDVLLARRVGQPWYTAPEQIARPSIATESSDVYALGCLLYQLLCGRVPFPGGRSESLLAHQTLKPLSPHQVRPMPQLLARLVRAMLRKEVSHRPDMAFVARVLSSF